MARAVYIRLVAGDVYPDWCDRCMTSARLRCSFYRLADDGPREVARYDRCQRCDVDDEDGEQ